MTNPFKKSVDGKLGALRGYAILLIVVILVIALAVAYEIFVVDQAGYAQQNNIQPDLSFNANRPLDISVVATIHYYWYSSTVYDISPDLISPSILGLTLSWSENTTHRDDWGNIVTETVDHNINNFTISGSHIFTIEPFKAGTVMRLQFTVNYTIIDAGSTTHPTYIVHNYLLPQDYRFIVPKMNLSDVDEPYNVFDARRGLKP